MALRNAGRERDSRFLSLFTVVRFPNSMCLTSSNSNGTCYTQQVRPDTGLGFQAPFCRDKITISIL